MNLLHGLTIAVSIVGGLASALAAILSRPSHAVGRGGTLTVTIEDAQGNRVRTRVPSARRAEEVRSVLDEALRRVA